MILSVKQKINGQDQWVQVPAIRGTSVTCSLPTQFPASGALPSGWRWTLYDERTNTSTDMVVYNGVDGTGAVSSVDGIGSTGGNVNLQAVRYTTMTPALSSAQQLAARSNINAMKNIEGSESGQVIMYDADNGWVAATLTNSEAPTAIPSADIINLFS